MLGDLTLSSSCDEIVELCELPQHYQVFVITVMQNSNWKEAITLKPLLFLIGIKSKGSDVKCK
jgi:hypothetical protein